MPGTPVQLFENKQKPRWPDLSKFYDIIADPAVARRARDHFVRERQVPEASATEAAAHNSEPSPLPAEGEAGSVSAHI